MHSKEKLFDFLSQFSLLFPGEQSKERLQAYTEYLIGYDFGKIVEAANDLAREENFFPTLKAFISKLEDPGISHEDYAQDLAGRILERAFGYSQYDKNINDGFTDAELQVIERFGGWKTLTVVKNEEINTLRAQLKKSCESLSRMSGGGQENLEYRKKEALLDQMR